MGDLGGVRGRWRAGVLALGFVLVPGAANAQLISTVVDRDGVSASCVTVGPLAPIAQEYCVRRTLAEGLLLKRDIGVSGLILQDDGDAPLARVATVTPGSPAAAAGILAGDALVSVDGVAVRRTPADVGRQLLFGRRGQPARLTLLRDGSLLDVTLVRAAEPEPAGAPHSPNILVGVHPMMNWRGEFIPCMGAGVLGPAAVAACRAKYARAGFLPTDALGASGLQLADDGIAGTSEATVAVVAPGSPAAKAGVRLTDKLQAVDGNPLTASCARAADALLFGKRGDSRRLVLERAGRTYTVTLILTGQS